MEQCEVCGSNDRLEKHHIIFGRGKRKQCETPNSLIHLCLEHHKGTFGVHGKNGHELDIRLKLKLQAIYFAAGYTEDKVRELMGGRLYLVENEVYK